ncbi:MAG TPA: DUF4321 domain-containing protein [Nitrospiria bacterium]|nr:DUF4321 domain-containing protein [Candidatus Manganitrophaceae bacterium]HIL34433.1 DUF4321 domain-containing protein [Candidatus Manganitrophaceae bacterium]
MAILNKTPWTLIFFILVGGLLGGVMGEILLLFSPSGLLQDIFLKGYQVGINPPAVLDLRLITFTIGFTFRINLLSLLGIILSIYTYKQA